MEVVWIESFFVFSLLWAVGATTDHPGRLKFDAFLALCRKGRLAEVYGEGHLYPSAQRREPFALKSTIPEAGEGSGETLYDLNFDTSRSRWVPWKEGIKSFTIPAGTPFHKMVVPTVDSARYTAILQALHKIILINN